MSESRALEMDRQDPLADFRERFHIPRTESGEEEIYLCGNSLGLQPRSIQEALDQEIGDWAGWAWGATSGPSTPGTATTRTSAGPWGVSSAPRPTRWCPWAHSPATCT